MFTGIITDIGRLEALEKRGDTRLTLSCGYDAGSIDIGASIACSGICLTVIERGVDEERRNWFSVDASQETLDCTTLATWKVGEPVNLERSLKMGDELGGHLVSGHVDGIGKIISIDRDGDSQRFRFTMPDDIAPFVAAKGSVALDGTSFTVNEVDDVSFGINIIPHTLEVTTWGLAKAGDSVNIEIDMLARYVARLTQTRPMRG